MAKMEALREAHTERAFLDAAEKLFAERGFEGAKVRAIADTAGANLGALHYYWGSKEELFRAVWRRRLDSLQKARNNRFEELKAQAAGSGITVEEVLTVMIETSLGVGGWDEPRSDYFQQLYGRALSDPSPAVQKVVGEYLDERVSRFVQLMALACPTMGKAQLYWGLHAVFGTILNIHIDGGRLGRMVGPEARDAELTAGAPGIIRFLAAGFESLAKSS